MFCIDITLNGDPVCRAGIDNASMIGVIIGGTVDGEFPGSFFLSGMCDLPNERAAHVYWCKEFDLSINDIMCFRFVDDEKPSETIEIKSTDSPEYLEEQRKFEEFDKNYVRDITPKPRKYPNLIFDCNVNGTHQASAKLSLDDEHILCSLNWHKWRPERCRIFVRSFGNEKSNGDKNQTEWLRANLSLDDYFEIRISA